MSMNRYLFQKSVRLIAILSVSFTVLYSNQLVAHPSIAAPRNIDNELLEQSPIKLLRINQRSFAQDRHRQNFEFLVFAEHQHRRFEDLTPEQKNRIRKRHDKFESLPPEERERIRRAKERFHNLSPEQRDELRKKWKKMTPEQREKFKREKRNNNYKTNRT